MINVTRMNGDKLVLNADLIETVEARSDTILTLTTGNRVMVKETVEELVKRVKQYKKEINLITLENLSRFTEESE